MRGASPIDHNLGGKHISGAECITDENSLKKDVLALLERAMNHPKGKSDFINISVQKIHDNSSIRYIDPLEITTVDNHKNILYPNLILKKLGFTEDKIKKALEILFSLKNIKGALIVSFEDFYEYTNKITRCSNIDYHMELKDDLNKFLNQNNFLGKYLKDALCLSSKICNDDNVLCELCISDDKGYTTGYISSNSLGYIRIKNFKPKDHEFGGRIIFIKDKNKLDDTINYLKKSPILIKSIPKINFNSWLNHV